MKVYIFRKACDWSGEWAEIETTLWSTRDFEVSGNTKQVSLPVHPGDLQERVRSLIAKGKPFATQSDIVIAMLGWMVRKGELKLPFSVIYVEANGTEHENPMDTRGDLVHPFPESGFECIQEAGFYYRYDNA